MTYFSNQFEVLRTMLTEVLSEFFNDARLARPMTHQLLFLVH